nr:MAG TPA: hypothetical protein [Caudoviricetes sp.]
MPPKFSMHSRRHQTHSNGPLQAALQNPCPPSGY